MNKFLTVCAVGVIGLAVAQASFARGKVQDPVNPAPCSNTGFSDTQMGLINSERGVKPPFQIATDWNMDETNVRIEVVKLFRDEDGVSNADILVTAGRNGWRPLPETEADIQAIYDQCQ